MANKKHENKQAPGPEEQTLIVLGEAVSILPEELQQMGLSDEQIEVQEIPGVAPTWKPVNKGDFLMGRVVDVREGLGKFASTAVVFQTAIPGGFRTVWLGADLKIKMRDPMNRVYSIAYDGDMSMPGKQPMKQYRVYEVRAKREPVPELDTARQVGAGTTKKDSE